MNGKARRKIRSGSGWHRAWNDLKVVSIASKPAVGDGVQSVTLHMTH